MFAVFASVTIILIDPDPKTSIGSSLKLLSLSDALLLFLALCHSVIRNFLLNKLYIKGYLPPFTKQGTEAFHVAVHHLPIDLQGLEPFL